MKAIVIGCLLLASISASAVRAQNCGDIIVADTTLSNDILDCPSGGLIIAASNITLNLNGHTISGKGSGDGIQVQHGSQQVKVTGPGTIKNFDRAVDFDFGNKHELSKLSLIGNNSGAVFNEVTKSNIKELDIYGGTYGLIFYGKSDKNKITQNDITGMRSEAIWFLGGSYNILSANYLLNNLTGLSFTGGEGNVFKYNHVIGSHSSGVKIVNGFGASPQQSAVENSIHGNKIYDNNLAFY